MTKRKFIDALVYDGKLRKTDDGHVIQARVARSGNVQVYRGSEMGFRDREFVRIYRPEDEVFDRKAISTYARKPITIGHPGVDVTDENWKELAVGEIDRDVVRDGEFVSVPLLFRDARAVALLSAEGAPRELSMGYEASVELRDGVSPEGEPYDAVIGNFRMNHVAVVAAARGGKELRIGDSSSVNNWGAAPITIADNEEISMTLRTIMVDGLSVQTTDAGAQAIDKLKGVIDAKDAELASREASHAKEVATKDAAIAKAEAERDDAKAKIVSDADLDKMVSARSDLISKARAISDADYSGQSEVDIRRSAVRAKLGDEAVKDRSDAYVEARFDILAEDAKPVDPLRTGLRDTKPVADAKTEAASARSKHLESLSSGWSQPVTRQ